MGENDKNERFVIRVELGDQRIIDWYKSIPVRHKSEAVTRALILGVPLAVDQLDLIKGVIQGLHDRLSELENWCQFTRTNFINQGATIERVEQRLDKFDSILARAQEIIDANSDSA